MKRAFGVRSGLVELQGLSLGVLEVGKGLGFRV